MTRLIVDASVAIAWCARNQATDLTDKAEVHVAAHGALLPPHFQIELTNALWRLERGKRIAPKLVDGFLKGLMSYGLEYDTMAVDLSFQTVLPLARRYGLSSYDAAYLELALRLGLPLATRDQSLATAARATGVALFQP